MAQVNVISVNPSKQTLGALNIDNIERMTRICQPGAGSFSFPGLKSVCNFIFGVNKSVTPAISVKLAIVRSLAAGLFILTVLTAMPLEINGYTYEVAAFVIGAMMFLGFFGRIAAFAGAALTATVAGISIHSSLLVNYDLMAALSNPSVMLSVVMATGMLAVSILGPGRISVDQLLNRITYKTIARGIVNRRAQRRERNAEMRLSYKAWSLSK